MYYKKKPSTCQRRLSSTGEKTTPMKLTARRRAVCKTAIVDHRMSKQDYYCSSPNSARNCVYWSSVRVSNIQLALQSISREQNNTGKQLDFDKTCWLSDMLSRYSLELTSQPDPNIIQTRPDPRSNLHGIWIFNDIKPTLKIYSWISVKHRKLVNPLPWYNLGIYND